MTTSTGSGSLGDPYTSEPSTSQKASAAKDAAKDEGRHVATVAKDEASTVAQEAKAQARNLTGELKTQLSDQSRNQKSNLVAMLRRLGDELEEMAGSSSSSGVASEVVRQAAGRTRDVGSFIETHEPGDLLQEVRRFAGRRPGTFLLGALLAGVAAGRLTRGAVTAHGVGSSGTTDVVPAYLGGTTGTGYADTGYVEGGYADTSYPRTTTVPPVGAPAESGVTSGSYATGPAVDPVEPGYGGVPVPTATPDEPGYGQPGGTRPGGGTP